jgi:hypothetical protein
MIRFPGVTPARRARLIGVLAVVLAGVFASGFFVVISAAAARHRPVLGPAGPSSGISLERPSCFSASSTGRARRTVPGSRSCPTIGTVARNFTVGGNLTRPLYPGASQRLDLTFTNPNSSPITIPRGGISASDITITSNAPGCASSNFAVTQGLASTVTVRADQLTATSLSTLGVPKADWPVIEMIETNTNQDACQGARLTLTYSGIEAAR